VSMKRVGEDLLLLSQRLDAEKTARCGCEPACKPARRNRHPPSAHVRVQKRERMF
jgi:hypothetical protein